MKILTLPLSINLRQNLGITYHENVEFFLRFFCKSAPRLPTFRLRRQNIIRTPGGCRGRFLGLGTLAGKCGGDDGRTRGDLGACCRTATPFPGLADADSWLAGLVTGSPRITCDKLLRRRSCVSGSLNHSRNSSSTLVLSSGFRAMALYTTHAAYNDRLVLDGSKPQCLRLCTVGLL